MKFHETLEVLHRLDSQLQRGVFVADESRAPMLLERGHSPHMTDPVLDGLMQGISLVSARYHDDDLFGVHHRANADSQRFRGNVLDFVVEETRVGDNRIFRERLNARARDERRSGFVEGDMTIGANTY